MNYRFRHRYLATRRRLFPESSAAIRKDFQMTAARKIDALNAARTIAQELGQNPNSKGTARLAEDLGSTETCYTVVQHEGTDLSPFPASIYGPDGEIAAVRNQGSDTARIAFMLAAAPDLLEACKAAEFGANHIDCVRAMQEVLPRIRAAIAKATKGGEA